MKEHTKILLIDDEDRSREAMLLLKSSGYDVQGAGSGETAFRLLAGEPFDLVITDLFLPDVNGI